MSNLTFQSRGKLGSASCHHHDNENIGDDDVNGSDGDVYDDDGEEDDDDNEDNGDDHDVNDDGDEEDEVNPHIPITGEIGLCFLS